jgi:hypothetical protein
MPIYCATGLALVSIAATAGWFKPKPSHAAPPEAIVVQQVPVPEAAPAMGFDATQPAPVPAVAQRTHGRLDD